MVGWVVQHEYSTDGGTGSTVRFGVGSKVVNLNGQIYVSLTGILRTIPSVQRWNARGKVMLTWYGL